MSLKSGHTINPVIYEEAVKQYEQFGGNRVGTIRLEPDGWFFTSPFITHANKVYDFKFKPTDIVIMAFPKCGTTWAQEIVWTMVYNPNLDNPKRFLPGMMRCPFMECEFLMKGLPKSLIGEGSLMHDTFVQAHPDRNPDDGIFIQLAELTENPRIIKTHLPFSLLPPSLAENSKIIYVVRDPKDIAVSYCHHSRRLKSLNFFGTTSDFVDHFVNDTLVYSPFWKHVKEAWKLRNKPNVHFIFYEDLKADPRSEILRLQNITMSLKSGHTINPVIYEESVKQYEQFGGNRVGTIRLEPDGWFFTSPFITHANKVYDFKFKPTDIVIMTFPKCGTTWTQEIVWTMGLPKSFFGEGSFLYDAFVQDNPDRNPDDGIFIQLAELTEDPRIIKTHLPFSLLSPSLAENSKIIYVVRDPKDVAVSYCHHSRLFKVVYSPFWKHVKEAWKLRNKPNVHFIFYEDLKADPRSEILRLQKFLNLNLTDRISGDYKNKLSTEDIEKINKWTTENTQEMEIDFKYKIRNV
ncbi:Sulfotransferase 1C4 [Armadillidium nasatum]|uniref:Sulfotransferase 1C4 n=1 Tax=Armadillidium nasatum TaxID=96803 RepID=A0A5N5TCK6_9CRUS|nr:Sulfotransferase 1C4 [Armadillidium nasatum]